MKILVTGSSGVIGRLVVQKLFTEGHTVIGVDVVASAPRETTYSGIFVHYSVNILDPMPMHAIIERWLPDAVIHLAAIMSGDVNHLQTINEGGTRAIFNKLNSSCRTFVFANTASKYTDVVKSCEHTELESLTERSSKISPYANTKLRSELLLQACVDNALVAEDLAIVSLNIFQLMGLPKQTNEGHMSYFKQIHQAYQLDGTFCVYAHQGRQFLRSYVSINDVADAFVLAATKPLQRQKYYDIDICADTPHTGTDIWLEIKHGPGVYSPSIIDIPNKDERFAPSITNLNKADLSTMFLTPNLIGDNRRAKEILGWVPKDSLRDIVRDVFRK